MRLRGVVDLTEECPNCARLVGNHNQAELDRCMEQYHVNPSMLLMIPPAH